MGSLGIPWYYKYEKLPYLHLGDNIVSGIDCLNLIILIYKNELNITIPYNTKKFCNDINENWYNNINNSLYVSPFKQFDNPIWGWKRINYNEVKPFDVVTLTIGSSNVPNHCALFITPKQILNIMINKPSWISPYGSYYKNYTEGYYRWTGLLN